VDGTFIQMEVRCLHGRVIGARCRGQGHDRHSGPGFSLMQEIWDSPVWPKCPRHRQRHAGRPSTGLPTMVSQGDVQQARWAPTVTTDYRPAVSTTQECFDLTVKALISRKDTAPRDHLSDEVVVTPGEAGAAPEHPWRWWTGCAPTCRRSGTCLCRQASGVRPWHLGTATATTSDYHDVQGLSHERPDEIEPFLNRLFRKINQHFHDINWSRRNRPGRTPTAGVAYGSVAASARRAVARPERASRPGYSAHHPVAFPGAVLHPAAPGRRPGGRS